MCYYGTTVKNPKYKKTAKNRGVIPPINDIRVTQVPIGCGECKECLAAKARDWQVRLFEEIKHNKNGKFVTLTFSNENIAKLAKLNNEDIGYDLDNWIATKALRMFNERWRKKTGKALRHFMVTELGHTGTENIHMHGIIWTDATPDEIRKAWAYGFIWPRKNNWKGMWVNERTVNYVVKYIIKRDLQHKHYKPIIRTSPGMGAQYATSYNARMNKYKEDGGTIEHYTTRDGYKIALPIYWRNKIYTEEEREKLWLEKLDKGERWIGGEKVQKHDLEDMYRLLKYYRKKNIKMGYGNGSKKWEEARVENQIRDYMIQRRILESVKPGQYPKEWDE